MTNKVLATNRKARHEYLILDTLEAGVVLRGSEIKSLRAGQMSLQESYVQIEDGEAWLVNAHIATYDPASRENHEPRRKRKLLLHKKEISRLWDQIKKKGVTIIPLKVYLKNGRAKIEIAAGQGKKLYDKRREIAKKDADMEMRRAQKNFRA